MGAENTAIRLEGVVQRYGRRPVLRGVDLVVPAGSTTVLLGANGEGKSTLLRLALGTLKPTGGTVSVLGLDPVRQARALRPRVAYVPDKPDVYEWMTLGEYFRFLRVHYATWSDERARHVADALGVSLDVRFKHFSRGQGMKAMLAGALGSQPDVLLLDEPFGGLDPMVRETVLGSVIGAIGDEPRAVLLATHDLDVAARLADRVALLAEGRISREGPVAEFASPDTDSATPESLHNALVEVNACAG
jgi:ABC-2 type transport system ATP-binding protein